ncbi:MAG: TerB family tellurite resistance protein [Bacteroidales bacterium]|nr:TerB family tellurite resistance protein [Bacteroidales bacterium]
MITFLTFLLLIFIYNAIAKLFNWGQGRVHTERYQRSDFLESLLILSADVIKADGHFKRSELDYLRSYLTRNLGAANAQQALLRLQEIMGENYNIAAICATLRNSSTIHERLLIVQFLFGLANADGELHPLEVEEIRRIAMQMGVSAGDYESIKAMYMGGYYQYGGGRSSSGSGNNGGSGSTYRSHTLDDDYKILEISPDATDEEVKKAYRTMAKKYHPDRVAHLGDDMRKQAEEKFAKLSDAYDNIRKSRGMK